VSPQTQVVRSLQTTKRRHRQAGPSRQQHLWQRKAVDWVCSVQEAVTGWLARLEQRQMQRRMTRRLLWQHQRHSARRATPSACEVDTARQWTLLQQRQVPQPHP